MKKRMFKKRILSVLILICMVLCSGCDVKYSLNFDKGINEEINFTNYVINYSDDLYFSPFETISQQYSYSGFANSESNYVLSKYYDNLEMYNNSVLFNFISSDDCFQTNGKKVSINCNMNDLINEIKNNYGNINNLEISLYIPYYVSKHNADIVKNNTYTWSIGSESVIINFDLSKPADFIQKIILYSVIGVIVIAIICVIIYFVNRNKKANEI